MFCSTVADFGKFLTELKRPSVDICRTYREIYYEPNAVILEPYVREHIGGMEKLDRTVELMFTEHLELYERAYQTVISEQLEAELEQYWQTTLTRFPQAESLPSYCYAIFGLGTMNGATFKTQKGPAVAVGLEVVKKLGDEDKLEALLLHEYTHIVYENLVLKQDEKDMNVLTQAINEGIATLAPLALLEKPMTDEDLMTVLWFTKEQFALAQETEDKYFGELMSFKSEPANQHREFFMYTGSPIWENGRVDRIGYYLGAIIVKRALEKGHSFHELLSMKPEEILALCQHGLGV